VTSPLYPNPFYDDRLTAAEQFNPALDVPSLHQQASEILERAIARVTTLKQPDGTAKVIVLRSIPGVGKTHIVGRVCHRLAENGLFVFVPQMEKHAKPVEHIHWHVLNRLFDAPSGQRPLVHHVLARLCHHSFRRYFDGLPHTVKERHRSLRERLDEGPDTVLEIVKEAKEPGPYLALADSVTARVPMLPPEIVRALILGWSPSKNEAWHWLRGEQVDESSLGELKLPHESPSAHSVISTLAILLHRLQMPVVIFFDQSELLLHQPGALKDLTTAYMGWLDKTPNLVLGLTFLSDAWKQLGKDDGFKGFMDRCRPLDLGTMSGPQAVELVRNRLAGWPGARRDKSALWPFREEDLMKFANQMPLFPRGLLKTCAAKLDQWLVKRSEQEVQIDEVKAPPPPPEELFRREWVQCLERVRKAQISPDNLQVERLFRSTREALQLLQLGHTTVGGFELLQMQEGAIKNELSLQLKIGLNGSSDARAIVVGVTKLSGGQAITHFLRALKDSVADPVVGAVLVRPGQLTVASKSVAREIYDKLRNEGKLRPFELSEHRSSFEQMECYLQLLDAADRKDLQLAQRPINQEECRQLAVKTQVLAGLDFFDKVFSGWVQAPKLVPTPSAVVALKQPVAIAKSAARPTAPRMGPKSPDKPNVPNIPPSPSTSPTQGSAWAQDLLKSVANKLIEFGQKVEPLDVQVGPTFVRLRMKPLGRTFIGKIRNHANDLRTHIAAITNVPVITDQAGYISIDVQRPDRQPVPLPDYLSQAPSGLNRQPIFPVGVDVAGKPYWLNLADPSTCHVLAAGTTGSGKSEFLKAMLAALAARLSPIDLKFVLIDPKRVTFNFPKISPYLLHPIAHTTEEAMPLVQACFAETEKRYALLEKRGLEHIGQFQGKEALSRIVIVFDEFADLMADRENRKELESSLKRIGALARAAGIHLVLATQRPDKDVVTPLLKANLPTRICLRVEGERNSKIILDEEGGEHLLGHGDLFWKHGGGLTRLQGMLVSKADLEKLMRFES
jgi:hypothetical protein